MLPSSSMVAVMKSTLDAKLRYRSRQTARTASPCDRDCTGVMPRRRANQSLPHACFTCFVQPLWKKYFCFTEAKSPLYPPRPVPQRGVAQRHKTRGGMRWTLVAPVTNGANADGKVVWS